MTICFLIPIVPPICLNSSLFFTCFTLLLLFSFSFSIFSFSWSCLLFVLYSPFFSFPFHIFPKMTSTDISPPPPPISNILTPGLWLRFSYVHPLLIDIHPQKMDGTSKFPILFDYYLISSPGDGHSEVTARWDSASLGAPLGWGERYFKSAWFLLFFTGWACCFKQCFVAETFRFGSGSIGSGSEYSK